ncbi:expressed unknown protein [Seminavis robusta]|uniref:Alpha-L-glutamate ligase-related protein ATP-grasp domain-containing protein n=1 Tax=Seminavis robusta TaxID=568900 RepID=A0A9N8DE94_9STRA|nr:expressed unknown protein [Seminavis robusta]|eukprot:Sro102_g051920.1 n/a (377) ;mRNA; f:13104-14592
MGQVLSLPVRLANHTLTYYQGLFHYLLGAGRNFDYSADLNKATLAALRPSPGDTDEDLLFKQNARIHLFALASQFYLYNKPHYRKGSYREDLVDNLENVAIPGTGIKLSWVACNRLLGLGFLTTAYPAISLVASFHQWFMSKFQSSISGEFATRLLAPDDWFSYWRLNCTVVGLHALLNNSPADYEMENKWTFLEEGVKRGVPVSPYLTAPGFVATVQDVKSLSCVFRAGRAGADTDHSSILFDVDVTTGLIRGGTTNAHWYRTGILEAIPGRCPWRSQHDYKLHPDGDIPVSGNFVPDIKNLLALVEKSHFDLCPGVPFAGWDVVLSADPDLPVCLLEVNLSCNFFRGSFDKKLYLDFIDDAFAVLQSKRLVADR